MGMLNWFKERSEKAAKAKLRAEQERADRLAQEAADKKQEKERHDAWNLEQKRKTDASTREAELRLRLEEVRNGGTLSQLQEFLVEAKQDSNWAFMPTLRMRLVQSLANLGDYESAALECAYLMEDSNEANSSAEVISLAAVCMARANYVQCALDLHSRLFKPPFGPFGAVPESVSATVRNAIPIGKQRLEDTKSLVEDLWKWYLSREKMLPGKTLWYDYYLLLFHALATMQMELPQSGMDPSHTNFTNEQLPAITLIEKIDGPIYDQLKKRNRLKITAVNSHLLEVSAGTFCAHVQRQGSNAFCLQVVGTLVD
jgi:hypothetical protein